MQQVVDDDRQHHIELERAGLAGDRDGGVVADHLGGDHANRFRNHRVDLAGHDRTAWLKCRQFDFTQPRQGACIHPAEVVGDLHQADGESLELAGKFHRRVLRAQAFEEVLVGNQRDAGLAAQGVGHASGKFRVSIDAGPDRRAALGQLVDPGQG